MAVQLLTPEEFEAVLKSRGCRRTDTRTNTGRFWQTSDGRVAFLVPFPDPALNRYPDWMLHDILEKLGLPIDPRN